MEQTQRFTFRCGSAIFALRATPQLSRGMGYRLEVQEDGDYFGTFYAAALCPRDLVAEIRVWLRLTTGFTPTLVAA